MSDLHEAVFTWPNTDASNVILTGTFDGWSRSKHLTKTSAGFEGRVQVPWGSRVQYKWIVDGQWANDSRTTEFDPEGNLNNVYISPPKPTDAESGIPTSQPQLPPIEEARIRTSREQPNPSSESSAAQPSKTTEAHPTASSEVAIPAPVAPEDTPGAPLVAGPSKSTDVLPITSSDVDAPAPIAHEDVPSALLEPSAPEPPPVTSPPINVSPPSVVSPDVSKALQPSQTTTGAPVPALKINAGAAPEAPTNEDTSAPITPTTLVASPPGTIRGPSAPDTFSKGAVPTGSHKGALAHLKGTDEPRRKRKSSIFEKIRHLFDHNKDKGEGRNGEKAK